MYINYHGLELNIADEDKAISKFYVLSERRVREHVENLINIINGNIDKVDDDLTYCRLLIETVKSSFDSLWELLWEIACAIDNYIDPEKKAMILDRIKDMQKEFMEHYRKISTYHYPILGLIELSDKNKLSREYVERKRPEFLKYDGHAFITMAKEFAVYIKSFIIDQILTIGVIFPNSFEVPEYDIEAYQNALLEFPEEDITEENIELLKSAINGFPLDLDGYEILLKLYGDEENELGKLADEFDIVGPMINLKKEILEEYTENIKEEIESEEELEGFIRAKAAFLGVRLDTPDSNDKGAESSENNNNTSHSQGSTGSSAYDGLSKEMNDSSSINNDNLSEHQRRRAVNHELDIIHHGIKGKDVVGKYEFYLKSKDHEWQFEESKAEIEKLKRSIKSDIRTLSMTANDLNLYTLIRVIVLLAGIVISVFLMFQDATWGMLAIIITIAAIIIFSFNISECKMAKQKLEAINRIRRRNTD